MRLPVLLFSLAMVATAGGCSGDKAASTDAPPAAKPAGETVSARRHDESSYAQPERVRIADLGLDLSLDFDQKQLAGTATYQLDWVDPDATQLVLGTSRRNRWARLFDEGIGAAVVQQSGKIDVHMVTHEHAKRGAVWLESEHRHLASWLAAVVVPSAACRSAEKS